VPANFIIQALLSKCRILAGRIRALKLLSREGYRHVGTTTWKPKSARHLWPISIRSDFGSHDARTNIWASPKAGELRHRLNLLESTNVVMFWDRPADTRKVDYREALGGDGVRNCSTSRCDQIKGETLFRHRTQ
jgi:hypothetical protein